MANKEKDDVNIRIDRKVNKKLKIKAAHAGITVKELLKRYSKSSVVVA